MAEAGVAAVSTCVVCQRRPAETDQVCLADRQWLGRILVEVVGLYALLPGQLLPGQSHGQRVSGSREAPLPLRVTALDLLMPARSAAVHDGTNPDTGLPYGDQVGEPGVASVLDSWCRDWVEVRDMGETLPDPTVVQLARWLGNRHDWACDNHPAVDDYANELRDLRSKLRAVNEINEVRPEHLDVPCRRCDRLALYRLPGEDRVECGGCGCLLTESEYYVWVRLLAAHMKEAVV